uniref:Ubiquitin-like protease family profile domain-containing protein n=1 Tax=Oryza nivara TaxID=4536 RepID=A0A0E0IZY3_ORYNI
MSKASQFTQKDSTTTRVEKSGEEKIKEGSKQGDSNVAHNGNAPPLEQNHPNNTDVCSQLPKTPQTKSTAEHETKSNINNTSTSKRAPPTENVICSQLQTTPPSKQTEQENSKSNSNKYNACKETQHAASSKDFVCSQQSNNSVASRTRAKILHSASPLSVVSISPSKKNSSDQKIRKAPLKATQPISTQPDKEESNKDGLFVEPICTIPAKKEEVQPTKDLESNSTEFVIDIEGPYDVEDITGHTTDKTKFILKIIRAKVLHKMNQTTFQTRAQIYQTYIMHFKALQPKFECLHHFDDKSKTNKSASLGHFLSQTTSGTNIMDIEHSSMQVTQGERYMHTPKTCINNKVGVQHLSANFTANIGNRRLEGQHCDENEYQDDFAEFLYEEEPSDNIDMVEQRAQPQINNEQSSPQTPLHINITSARTPATKKSSQSSPNIGMNSPRIAQMREPNQHAQTEERQYSMTRIIDSLNASGNCSVLMDNVKVTWSSLSKSLSPRGVVDTYVLNAYAKKIANDQNNKENEYINFYFFHRTSLIFPCLYDNHWFVFTVDIKGHHFVFLDSIYDENSKYHKKIQGLLIPGLLQCGKNSQMHDCGIYAMKCMEWWNPRIHLKDMIRPEYIPNMRKQIANDLLCLEYNSQ